MSSLDKEENVLDGLHEDRRHDFQVVTSSAYLESLRNQDKEKEYGFDLQILYLGIAAVTSTDGRIEIAFSTHDGTYNIDFSVTSLKCDDNAVDLKDGSTSASVSSSKVTEGNPEESTYLNVADWVVSRVRDYSEKHMYKFAGAGISKRLSHLCPEIPARLWLELDIIPFVFEVDHKNRDVHIDEEADSMARKCVTMFGPTQQPRLQVAYHNEVKVDCAGVCHLVTSNSYQKSVRKSTWDAAMKYASQLKERKIKIAFFSSTPQGGGVALMRHALIRFFRVVGVECKWYVPRPKPEVFRITKDNHNILQGVADPDKRFTPKHQQIIGDWIKGNAQRFWLTPGGPLCKGEADIVMIDDPQMPDLIQIAKEQDPDRPVIFRSHIQIRADLAEQEGTPTSEVWKWLWERARDADVFISHPVPEFVPKDVPLSKVGYMPAATDWLDGLNKDMSEYSSRFYLNQFNQECQRFNGPKLMYPARPYIAQIARFDPSKGIPVVLATYAELRRKYMHDFEPALTPQLVLVGHAAVDDPDATIVYDECMDLIRTQYEDLRDDIIVSRVGPVDQILNTLLANAHVALQLSTREGFEVKVSEALHHGVPIIAAKAGGIPLQVVHGKSGFLVEPGEHKEAAKYLHQLFTESTTYKSMSSYAKDHVSDEVSAVGNALNWMYLALQKVTKKPVEPHGQWIQSMAREEIGLPIADDEVQLPHFKHRSK